VVRATVLTGEGVPLIVVCRAPSFPFGILFGVPFLEAGKGSLPEFPAADRIAAACQVTLFVLVSP
jgi:hypothetical protein